MNLLKSFKKFLEKKDNSTESPEGFCPQCWGRQEYEGKFYEAVYKEKINTKNYDYAFFLTTQWRVVPISWSIGKAMKAAVDDKKRRKNLWIKSFSVIFPEALENHIVQRNLLAAVASSDLSSR